MLIESNGDFYEGMFVDGNAEGFGIYRFTDGRKYEGNHKNGKPYVVHQNPTQPLCKLYIFLSYNFEKLSVNN